MRSSFFAIFCLKTPLETCQVCVPEDSVLFNPRSYIAQGFRLEIVATLASATPLANQVCGAQYAEMLADGGAALAEIDCERVYGHRAAAQAVEDGAPRGVCDGAVNVGPESMLFGARMRNHRVT
jgi:hypothetical protein